MVIKTVERQAHLHSSTGLVGWMVPENSKNRRNNDAEQGLECAPVLQRSSVSFWRRRGGRGDDEPQREEIAAAATRNDDVAADFKQSDHDAFGWMVDDSDVLVGANEQGMEYVPVHLPSWNESESKECDGKSVDVAPDAEERKLPYPSLKAEREVGKEESLVDKDAFGTWAAPELWGWMVDPKLKDVEQGFECYPKGSHNGVPKAVERVEILAEPPVVIKIVGLEDKGRKPFRRRLASSLRWSNRKNRTRSATSATTVDSRSDGDRTLSEYPSEENEPTAAPSVFPSMIHLWHPETTRDDTDKQHVECVLTDRMVLSSEHEATKENNNEGKETDNNSLEAEDGNAADHNRTKSEYNCGNVLPVENKTLATPMTLLPSTTTNSIKKWRNASSSTTGADDGSLCDDETEGGKMAALKRFHSEFDPQIYVLVDELLSKA